MGTFAWAALGLVLVGLSVVLYVKLSAGYLRKTRLVRVDLERGGGKELFVMVHGCGIGLADLRRRPKGHPRDSGRRRPDAGQLPTSHFLERRPL